MSIIFHDELSNDRNFFFEFQCQYDLKYEKKVYVYVVNNYLTKMLVRNVTLKSIILTQRT